MPKLDLNELAKQIRTMTRQKALYKVLKTELGAQGYWKNKSRPVSK